jgi:tetratricopeptide (TPR) repeat protein
MRASRIAPAVLMVAVLCTTASWSVGAPRGGDAHAEARGHFERGLELYKLERYQQALDEFERGYALAPRPRFLISIGQCHRRLGALASARVAFRRFLAAVPQDDPDRPRVAEMLREVETALGPEASLASPPPDVGASVASPTPTLPALEGWATPSPREERRASRRYWPFALGAAVVAVGVGVYVLRRDGGAGCRAEDLSCLDLR